MIKTYFWKRLPISLLVTGGFTAGIVGGGVYRGYFATLTAPALAVHVAAILALWIGTACIYALADAFEAEKKAKTKAARPRTVFDPPA